MLFSPYADFLVVRIRRIHRDSPKTRGIVPISHQSRRELVLHFSKHPLLCAKKTTFCTLSRPLVSYIQE
ncbi:hypothetical protein BO443_150093 [Burkholderia orbicola]